MRVKFTIHRKAEMVGQTADVDDVLGERLIAAGHATRVDAPRVARTAGTGRAGGGVVQVPAGSGPEGA